MSSKKRPLEAMQSMVDGLGTPETKPKRHKKISSAIVKPQQSPQQQHQMITTCVSPPASLDTTPMTSEKGEIYKPTNARHQ